MLLASFFAFALRFIRLMMATSINAETTNTREIKRYCPKEFSSDAVGLSDYNSK